MTHDQIRNMVRRGNPVPDPRSLDTVEVPVLLFVEHRSIDMQTEELPDLNRPTTPKYPWKPVAAVAGLVIAIGVVVWANGPDDGPEPADPPPVESVSGPVELVEAFLGIYTSGAAGVAANYMTQDADTSGLVGGDNWRLGLDFMAATGYRWEIEECVETAKDDTGTNVRCAFSFHALRSQELGRGPYGDNLLHFRVEDGRITSVTSSVNYLDNGFSTSMWEPFARWMAEVHPEDIATLYADGRGQTTERITEDSIPLWAIRTGEWVSTIAEDEGLKLINLAPGYTVYVEPADYDFYWEVQAICSGLPHVFGSLSGARNAADTSEETLALLHELEWPDGRDYTEVFDLMDQYPDIYQRIADAYEAGDSELLNELSAERVELTQAKNLAGDYIFWNCPIPVPA